MAAADDGPYADFNAAVARGTREVYEGPLSTAQGRTRNRRGEGGRLREQLVSAAGELLDETGDRGAITLRALARRVGVAATSIYAHFDGHRRCWRHWPTTCSPN